MNPTNTQNPIAGPGYEAAWVSEQLIFNTSAGVNVSSTIGSVYLDLSATVNNGGPLVPGGTLQNNCVILSVEKTSGSGTSNINTGGFIGTGGSPSMAGVTLTVTKVG